MYCIKCGSENVNEAKFCFSCGALIQGGAIEHSIVKNENEISSEVTPELKHDDSQEPQPPISLDDSSDKSAGPPKLSKIQSFLQSFIRKCPKRTDSLELTNNAIKIRKLLKVICYIILFGFFAYLFYSLGYVCGKNVGYKNGFNVAYEAGYANGDREGKLQGEKDGRAKGFNSGFSVRGKVQTPALTVNTIEIGGGPVSTVFICNNTENNYTKVKIILNPDSEGGYFCEMASLQAGYYSTQGQGHFFNKHGKCFPDNAKVVTCKAVMYNEEGAKVEVDGVCFL